MPRSPAAFRHVAAHRLAFAITALTVLVTTVSAATAAGFAAATAGAAVRRSLSAGPASAILVTAPATLASAPADSRQVTGTLAAAGRGLPLTTTVSLWSQPLNLPPGGPGGTRAQTQVISLPGLQRHARLVSGSWPRRPAGGTESPAHTGAGGGTVSVCVPASAARLLHLTAGETLTLRDSQTKAALRVRVTGVFRPLAPRASYWALSPLGRAAVARSAGFASYGPLVTTPAAAASGRVPVGTQAWLAVPDARAARTGNLSALGARIAAADSRLVNSAALGAVVSTRLPGLLQALATALVVARSQLLLGFLILLVIAGATLIVAIQLLGSQRAGEPPLLVARGASRRQLARRGAAEAAVVAVPAAIAGPLIGGLVVPLLTRYGPLAAAGIRLDPGRPAAAWLASSVVAAYSGLIIARPWLRRPPSPLQQRAAWSRQRAIAATASAGADIALIAIAAVAGWQLAHGPAPAAGGLTATIGVDPVLAVAPVLALAAGTLVMLRLLPLAARLADRAAARGRGLTVAAASWQISRKPLQQGGPALLAVLAVAASVLALATVDSWRRSVTEQADFTVGAAARITMSPAAALGIGQVAAVTAARGVRASTPAIRTQLSLPQGTGTLLALNGQAAATVIPADSLAASGLPADGSPGGRPASDRAPAALLRQLGRSARPEGTILPGRRADIVITARFSRAPAASPVLSLQLTDAAGVGYLVTAGSLPADGRAHRLRVAIAPGADFPLRLRGFSLQYLMPPVHSATATLTVESVRTGRSRGRTSSGPAAAGVPLPALGPDLVKSVTAQTAAPWIAPAIRGARRDGRSLSVRLRTGSGGPTSGQGGPTPATLTVGAGPPAGALTGIATQTFLAATGHRLGSTISVPIQGVPVSVTLAGEVTRFPTITAPGGGLIIDQAALQEQLLQDGIPPAAVGEWWLSAPAGIRPRGLPAGTVLATTATVAAGLRAQPLSAAGLQELLAVAAVALVLACAGFGVSVAAGRDRDHDTALLDALGAGRGQVAMLLSLEQAMLAVPAAAAGLLLGVLLSHLIIPAVSLTAQATRPVPPLVVHVPLLPAIAVAAAIAAIPPLAAALTGLRRMRAAAMLRAEAET